VLDNIKRRKLPQRLDTGAGAGLVGHDVAVNGVGQCGDVDVTRLQAGALAQG